MAGIDIELQAGLEEDKAAFEIRLINKIKLALATESKAVFQAIMTDVRQYHKIQVPAPFVSDDLVPIIKDILVFISAYENISATMSLRKIKKCQLPQNEEEVERMTPDLMLNAFASLDAMAKASENHVALNKLVHVKAVALTVELLDFDMLDTKMNREDLAATNKRYLGIDENFLLEVCLELAECMLQQKFFLKCGLFFRAIRKKDVLEVASLFDLLFTQICCEDGNSVLLCGVKAGDELTLDFLMTTCRVTEETNKLDKSSTVLHYAASHSNPSIMQDLLLATPKDILTTLIDQKDAEEQAPIHIAAVKGNLEIYKLLCLHGACYNALGKEEKSVLNMATGNSKFLQFYSDLAELFMRAGEGDLVKVKRILDRSAEYSVIYRRARDDVTKMTPTELLKRNMRLINY